MTTVQAGFAVEDITELEQINASHAREHGRLHDGAFSKIAALQGELHKRLIGTPRPQAGDIVILHGENSSGPVTYERGHLDPAGGFYGPDMMHACAQPYDPFVAFINDRVACIGDTVGSGALQWSTSGGYWLGIKTDAMKHVGTSRKLFWTWRSLPCGNGGLHFYATVNVWEYTDNERVY